MKKYSFFVPIYKYRVYVLFGNVDDINEYLERIGEGQCSNSVQMKTIGFLDHYQTHLFINTNHKITNGSIAHEALHIVQNIFLTIGQESEGVDQETTTYLLEYIVEQIHKTINRRK